MRTSVQIKGVEELQRKMQELPRRVRSKVTRKAVMAGSTIVLQAARRSVARRSGVLAKSLGRKGKTTKQGYYVKVGSRRGFQVDRNGMIYNPTRVAHLVEKGTKPHQIVSRRHPGARKQPFLNPALDQNISQIKATMASKMAAEIAAEAKSS